MLIKPTHLALASLSLLAHTGLAIAQPCISLSKLGNPSPAASDYFGYGVAMSFGGPNNRPLLAIGKPYEDSPAGADAGGWSVWQHVNGSWSLAYDAWNATGEANEHAGISIGLSDPYMIVGAPGYQSRGRVRILKRATNSNTWLLDDDLNPGLVQGSQDADYGRAAAISAMNGGWAIVGAPFFNRALDDSGRVDIFYRNAANEWIQSYSIDGATNGLAADSGNLGISVSMSQTTSWAAWGAPGQSAYPQFPRSGTAYVIGRFDSSPTLIRRTDNEIDMRFGTSVAIEGEWLAVGAPGKDALASETNLPANITDSGAVFMYHYENNAWVQHSTLRAPLPTASASFGSSIRMSGDQLIVTEFWRRRVYVFRLLNGVWSVQATFENPDSNADTNFGGSIAIRDGLIATSDIAGDINGFTDAGAVYTASVAPTLTSGDTCSNPIPMPTTDFVGCTEIATPSAGSVTTCGLGGSGQGPDVWFRFQPACDGNAIIDTFGSDFDTVLSVHSQCPTASSGNSIVCNDDSGFAAPNNRASLLTFNFQGGSTYLIRVSGYNAASGQFTLRSLLSYGVSNDTCATAPTVAAGSYNFNTCSATDSAGPVPLGTVRDIWYRFIAPATASYNFTTCGTGFNTVITLFNGTQSTCPTSPAAMIAQNDNNGICNNNTTSLQSFLQTTLTQGQSIMIRVGGAAPGEFGPGVFGIGQPINCDDIDFNNNTVFPEDQDVIDFFNVLAGGDCSPGNTCNDIDFNNNTVFPEDQDVIDFFTVLAGGDC